MANPSVAVLGASSPNLLGLGCGGLDVNDSVLSLMTQQVGTRPSQDWKWANVAYIMKIKYFVNLNCDLVLVLDQENLRKEICCGGHFGVTYGAELLDLLIRNEACQASASCLS